MEIVKNQSNSLPKITNLDRLQPAKLPLRKAQMSIWLSLPKVSKYNKN